MTVRPALLLAALAVALAASGCGRDDGTPTAPAAATGSAAAGLVDPARCTGTTTGVTADSITFGMSHPESGPSAITGKIGTGVQAYFDHLNATRGGVHGHKLRLVEKDDAGQAARTVANVNELLEKDQVFGFVQNLGTPNNLAVWDRLDAACVPNLLVGNGAPSLTDPTGHPFTIIANAPYAAEVAAFVEHLEQVKPNAKIALIYENSDFGASYRDPLVKAVQGTSLQLVAQQTYEPSDPNVTSQFTALTSAGADALFIGAVALKCPQSMDAAAGKGFDVVYLSANCTSKAFMNLARPTSTQGVLSESAAMEPVNPAWASHPRMQEYLTNFPTYAPGADPLDSLHAYGWTQGAVLASILDASPALDRVAVINTARRLSLPPTGLMLDGISWRTDGVADPFPVESFRLQTWDSAKGFWQPLGALSAFEGKSSSLR